MRSQWLLQRTTVCASSVRYQGVDVSEIHPPKADILTPKSHDLDQVQNVLFEGSIFKCEVLVLGGVIGKLKFDVSYVDCFSLWLPQAQSELG